jgi:hypothetical protein
MRTSRREALEQRQYRIFVRARQRTTADAVENPKPAHPKAAIFRRDLCRPDQSLSVSYWRWTCREPAAPE